MIERSRWIAAWDGALAAVRLMRLAFPLLDRAGCVKAALHLQHAIDEADAGGPAELTDEEMTIFLGAATG